MVTLGLGLAMVFPVNLLASECHKAREFVLEGRGIVYSNPNKAEDKYRSAIMLCPKSANLNFNLAMFYYKLDRLEESKEQLAETIKKNPQHAKALNGMAYLMGLTLDDNLSLGYRYISQALLLEPTNKKFIDTKKFLDNIAALAPVKTSISKPNAVAVVIGNKQYSHELVPNVKYAHRDSRLIKSYLTQTMGFREQNIIYLEDCSKADLERVFGNASDYHGDLFYYLKSGRSDIFIYYSGHGSPDPNTMKTYLLPSEATPSGIRFSGYPMEQLYENLYKIKKEKEALSMTVVFESCFSGITPAGELVKDASSLGLRVVDKRPSLPANTTVFTSSSGNQISSWSNEQRHGLFTYSFLKTIRDAAQNNKALNAGLVMKNLTGDDGVNDFALRNYHRQQNPQVFGSPRVEFLPRSY